MIGGGRDDNQVLGHPALSQAQFGVVLGHPVLTERGSDYQDSVTEAQQQDTGSDG
jgi:hypothetical protein